MLLTMVIYNEMDWKNFNTRKYPDGNWQLIIKKDAFEVLSKKVGFTYNTLKKCSPYKLLIENRTTKKSRTFRYLGMDTQNNIDHWYSNDDTTGPRLDLFVEI